MRGHRSLFLYGMILAAGILFFVGINALAQVAPGPQEVTITTYYPAPYGVYHELTTTGNTYLATEEGNVGIGTTSPGTYEDEQTKLDVAGVDAYAAADDVYLKNPKSGNSRWAGESATKVKYARSPAHKKDKTLFCPADYPVLLSCFACDNEGTLFDTNPANRGNLGGDFIYLERVKSGDVMGCIAYDDGHDHKSYFIEIVCSNCDYEEF